MNKPTILAALFLTFFITAAFGAAPPTTQSTITGRVLDPSGKAIPNAQIDFQGPNFVRATANANGEYSVTVRQAGEYRIGARAEGFITIEYYRSRDAIGINGGQVKHDITMQPGVVVRVKVLDLIGNPMS